MDRAEERRWGRAKPLLAGPLLRHLREAAGITQRRLCERIGMTPSQLSDIERGIQQISLRRAAQVAGVLGDSFLFGVLAAILQDKLEEAGFGHLRVVVYQPDQDEPTAAQLTRRPDDPSNTRCRP